jgi:hypothetical protein
MAIPDDVKRQALEALEAAHSAESKGLRERLRICNWSFKDFANMLQRARAVPLVSVAEAAKFDAERAKILVEGVDAKIADLLGAAPDQIVIIKVSPYPNRDGGLLICASLVLGGARSPDDQAPLPLLAAIDATGKARLLPLGATDRTWKIGADGDVRLA